MRTRAKSISKNSHPTTRRSEAGQVARRMDSGLVKAIAKYRKAARLALDESTHAEEGPFLVATKITRFAYERWSSVQEKKWQLLWNGNTREVWLYGDPSPLHEMAGSYFQFMTGHRLPEDAVDKVTTQGSPTTSIPDGMKEPDFTIRPREAKLPTVVGEVAYHNESFPRLVEEKEMWCRSDFIQFFVGLKITDRSRTQKRDPKLTLITWRRDTNKSETIEFGHNSACVAKNQMYLRIPFSLIFHQSTIPPSLSHQNSLDFDLFDIRGRVKDEIRNQSS